MSIPENELPSPPAFLRRMVDPPAADGGTTDVDLVAELARLIGEAPNVPRIATEASDRMRHIAESTAAAIRKVAQERVDAAKELQQHAESYASIVVNAGDLLCRRIEQEAVRMNQAALLLEKAGELVAAQEAAPDGRQPS